MIYLVELLALEEGLAVEVAPGGGGGGGHSRTVGFAGRPAAFLKIGFLLLAESLSTSQGQEASDAVTGPP